MKLELRGTATEKLHAAIVAALTEPTRSTMDPVDFAQPRWTTALFVALVTVAWAAAAAIMIALSPEVDQRAIDYQRALSCEASRTVPDCRTLTPASIEQIIYRTDHYRYLWQAEDQRLELRLDNGTNIEAHFDGTPHWSVSVGQTVNVEVWRGHVTLVTAGHQQEATANNPIYERDQDRLTTIGIALIALAFGIGAAVLVARAAWYKPLADYRLNVV